MKMVVLDGYTLNPGDLSWDAFHEFGELVMHDRTSPQQIIERARDAEILFTNKTPITREHLLQLPALRYIGVLATGYNVVDIKSARELGIIVTNIPTYGTDAVAQFTFALILEMCNQVGRHERDVRDGGWSRSQDFCYYLSPYVELAGKTLGIIGFGRIGKQVAKIAQAFGMRVCVVRSRRSEVNQNLQDEQILEVSLEELLRMADIVSLHCPLTAETKGLMNRARIAMMKPSAMLVNTSRGGLVVDEDLAEALDEKRLAGAALDVLSVEPPDARNPLLAARNCIVTPHIAWATREARSRLMTTAAMNVRAFLAGSPQNCVEA